MEFVEGETLAERLARGPLPLDQALAYAVQIADALDKAHRHGIRPPRFEAGQRHGDEEAGVKLLDFGLAEQRAQALPPGWADAVTRTTPIGRSGHGVRDAAVPGARTTGRQGVGRTDRHLRLRQRSSTRW